MMVFLILIHNINYYINLITHLNQVKNFIHLSRDKGGNNFYVCASF